MSPYLINNLIQDTLIWQIVVNVYIDENIKIHLVNVPLNLEEWVMVWLGAEKEEGRHKIAQSGPRKNTQKKEDKGQNTKKRTMASFLCVIRKY